MSTWTTKKLTNFLGLITTDEQFYVLLGGNEDKILVWNLPTLWTEVTKNTSVFTNKIKNSSIFSNQTKN
jgi:hypothetical protein